MTGSSLPWRGELGEVAAVALQGLVGAFRRGGGDALVAADLLHGLHEALAGEAELLEQAAGRAAVAGHGQEQVLDRDVVVLEAAGLVFGLGQEAVEAAGDVDLVGRARGARDLGEALQFLLEGLEDGHGRHVRLVEDGRSEAVVLQEKGGEQVLDVDLLVAVAQGGGLGGLEGLLGFFGEAGEVHTLVPVLSTIISTHILDFKLFSWVLASVDAKGFTV